MRTYMYLSLGLLFLAISVPTNAQSPPAEPSEAAAATAAAPTVEPEIVYYDVGRAFSFNCTLRPAEGQPAEYVWKKNGTAVSELADLSGRYKLEEQQSVLRVPVRTFEDDFGNYSCALGGRELAWDLRGRPYAKIQSDTNVVEGQNIKLVCRVIGKPYPPVQWLYTNETENGSLVSALLGERAAVNGSGVELQLRDVRRSDAGRYACAPQGGEPAATLLRVKGMYAALWPFLGICAEVFVLCAIILVYEKRRTKPELDDSDTDNHDQKKS